MIAALLLLTAAVDVRFVTKVEPRSWQPIDPKDTEKMLEQKALDQLTKKGAMKLTKTGFADVKAGDYALLIEGRFIEDAEQFSTYLTFGPGKKSNVPSFYVIDTAAVGDKSPAEMQKIIVALVERAAKRLNALLDPHLSLPDSATMQEPDPMPIDFGTIEIPEVKQPTGSIAKLINVRNEDYVRQGALGDIGKYVFDQPMARAAVERCAIADPLPKLRADCVSALAPVARTRLETQRLLLWAMRNDVAWEVVNAICSVSKSFVGLSRREAVATWLDVLSAESTPAEAGSTIAQLLGDENNIPNLELAVTRCLNQETLAYGKKAACAQYLLPKLPKERYASVISRYLETAKVWDQGEANVIDDIDRYVLKGSEPLDPQLAALIERVMLSPRLLRAQHTLVYALRRHPKPTADTVDRMLKVVAMNDNSFFVPNTLSDLLRAHPELKDSAIVQIKRFIDANKLMRRPNQSDPNKALSDLVARLEKSK